MRPVVAAIAAVILLGGVHVFLWLSGGYGVESRVLAEVAQIRASGMFAVEITLTFDAETDPFFTDQPTSLRVMLGQIELLRRSDRIEAGSTLRIEPVASVAQGRNEFYVEAVPSSEATTGARAVRVRVLRDGEAVADQTLWAEPGEPVAGPVVVDVPRRAGEHPAHAH